MGAWRSVWPGVSIGQRRDKMARRRLAAASAVAEAATLIPSLSAGEALVRSLFEFAFVLVLLLFLVYDVLRERLSRGVVEADVGLLSAPSELDEPGD